MVDDDNEDKYWWINSKDMEWKLMKDKVSYILKIINKNSVLHRNAAVISCKKWSTFCIRYNGIIVINSLIPDPWY